MVQNNLIRWIWLTDIWKSEIQKFDWLENENKNLKEKNNRLQEDLTRQKSWTHNPLIVWVITTIVWAMIWWYITYLVTCTTNT